MAGALIIVVLGVVVLLASRKRANRAFAVFAMAFGASFIPFNLLTGEDLLTTVATWASALLRLVAAGALAKVLSVFPKPLVPEERRNVWIAGAWALVYLLGVAGPFVGTWIDAFRAGANPRQYAGIVQVFCYRIVLSTFFGGLVLLALRFRSPSFAEGRWRQELALMATALTLFFGFISGVSPTGRTTSVFTDTGLLPLIVTHAVMLVGMVVLASLWLHDTTVAPGGRYARNLAWLSLGMPAFGLWLIAFRADAGYGGIARTLMAAMFAYAIVRHQLLGIDVKVKWTIKQSTIAAAFIGVFFIVAESTQTVFQSRWGPYWGIGAAGLLVFALAPLQRAAERIANFALPGVRSPDQMSANEREGAYLEASRTAWSDGSMTREERAMLRSLQLYLRLGDSEAQTLERKAEAEAARAR